MVDSFFLRSTAVYLRRRLPIGLVALGALALALYAYRSLLARPFVADDYQWLLSVRDLEAGQVLRTAFDAGAQTHFYRPLVWLLFWGQQRLFGLDPRGYHLVTLALHLLNAALLGALAWRLAPKLRIENEELRKSQSISHHSQFSILNSQFFPALLAGSVVLLHPAPFEAVAWISAQSELLAAALLLVMLHLWLRPTTDPFDTAQGRHRPPTTEEEPVRQALRGGQENGRQESGRSWPRIVLATIALGLALLAKESAALGLPLLLLMDNATRNTQHATRNTFHVSRFTPYLLPALLTGAYVTLQVAVERRNYLLQAGGYGLGPQLALNPLRSLALIAAPLPGTEHADAAWLVPVGAMIALVLVAVCILRGSVARRLVLALLLTLLPTAPFVSPPDSRYLYLPVMAGALLMALGLNSAVRSSILHPPASILHPARWVVIILLAVAAASELGAREQRFAAAGGPGGSLLRAAESACAERRDWRRIIVIEPPLAAPHVEAAVKLACGPEMRTKIMRRDEIPNPIKPNSVVISFEGGAAKVEQTSPTSSILTTGGGVIRNDAVCFRCPVR